MNVLQQLTNIQENLLFFIPELLLSLLFVLIILTGLIFKRQSKIIIPCLVYTGYVALCIADFYQLNLPAKPLFFSGMILLSPPVLYLKFLFAICGLLTLAMSMLSKQVREQQDRYLEYYAVITSVLLGSHLLVMSANLLMAFLSLEIISVGSYILVAFVFSKKTSEASMKYILFGMFASGIMLYGMSFLFGFTGSLDFTSDLFLQKLSQIHPAPVLWALGLTFAGILFKISAFPFHLWTPDVYEGTPLPLAVFFSTTTKIAGFGLLLNFMPIIWHYDFTIYFTHLNAQVMIGIIAMLTITIGNFSALAQGNIKRMLGYSAIAQSGFILLPLVSDNPLATEAALFYIGTYAVMSFAAFFLVEKLVENTGSDFLEDYKGIGLAFPVWGILIIVAMLALTGLPPTGGFIAKLFVFTSLWETYKESGNTLLAFLFAFGLLNTVIALFFYIKIPFYMFFKRTDTIHNFKISWISYLLAGFLCFILLAMFFKADIFVNK